MSLLGIDLGTSGIKCVAYDVEGTQLKKVYREYSLHTPEIGTVELDPELVWESLKKNLMELNFSPEIRKDPVTALSISVSADEALPVDNNGKVLYNAIMSMDKRGSVENSYINDVIGAEQVYRITGMPPDNIYALNRLLWFKNNKPGIYEKTYKFLCWEDFIFYRLGSEPSTDYSVACRTLAFNVIENKWAENIIEKAGADISKFPAVYPSGTEVGRVSEKLCSELGFKNKVLIITGGFDQCCAALGAGITRNSMVSIGTGTVEVMQVCFDSFNYSKKMMDEGYSFNTHVLENLFICLSLNFNGGVVFKWYRDNFGYEEKVRAKEQDKEVYDLIMDSAADSKFPVVFLPYFEGAQTPWKNPSATGTILGITLRTKKEDIIRGMMEGVTFDLKLNLEKIEESGIRIDRLRASGGGSRSETWLQFKADILGRTIQKLDIDESGCMSAAVLAGYGSKEFNSVAEVIDSRVKIKKEYEPDYEKFKRYEERYHEFINAFKKISGSSINIP